MDDQLFADDTLPQPEIINENQAPKKHVRKSREEPSFEAALEQLESLVGRMESGKQPLEQLIADFENGTKLIQLCRGKLNTLERKIELLTRDDGNQGQWTEFDAAPPRQSGEPF